MKIVIVRTVPGEILLKKITYNEQYIGLARALMEKGHQCDIVCGAEHEDRVEEIITDKGRIIKIYFVKSLSILKNNILFFDQSLFDDYDIIQSIEYNQIYTWYLSKKYRHKFIVYHGPYYSDFNKRYNIMAKLFDSLFLSRYLKYDTQFITKSEMAKNYLKNKGIKNVQSIGVGIDVKIFIEQAKVYNEFYDEIEGFNVDFKLLYIGRIEPRRNSIFLLEILKALRSRNLNMGLVIIGKGDVAYMKLFMKKIKEYRLENYIIYKEELEQRFLSRVYHLTDVFILPTYYDIYGMVILEAMYFKIPLITSYCGGAEMMIESGKSGIIIKEFDVEKWCDGIRKLYKNKAYCNEIVIHAHSKLVNEFTWEKLSDKFIYAYKRMLDPNDM